LRGARLLVVDDEQGIRDALVRVLGMYGATVRAAGSANDAIACLDTWVPDLIVSDIGMPGRDGYDLVRELRARPPERGGTIPALALTAHAGREARVRAIAAGFQRHLEKPIDAAHLAIAIDELLRMKSVRSAS
jgi:CheY-like chemotaxis protein